MPVHKGRDRDNWGHYRRATPTSIVPEVVEWAARTMVVNRLEANKLMILEQHSLWQKLSCLANFISFLDGVTGRIDRGKRVEVFYLDI